MIVCDRFGSILIKLGFIPDFPAPMENWISYSDIKRCNGDQPLSKNICNLGDPQKLNSIMTDTTKMAVEVFDRCAAQYQDKFMDISLYKDSFDLFCNNIRPNAAILEIACGPGNITKYLLDKRPDFQLLGIDLAPNMLRLAALNNPTAAFQLMDAKDIGNIGKMYDAIMCGFCLPYLSKEEVNKLIADAAGILTTDGILYMSTMEDHYSRSGLQKTAAGNQLYMYYYEAADLTAMLAAHQFRVIAMDRKVYPGPDSTIITDLEIIARK